MGASVSNQSSLVQTVIEDVVNSACSSTQSAAIKREVNLSTEDCKGVDIDTSSNINQGLVCDQQVAIQKAAESISKMGADNQAGLGISASNQSSDIETQLTTLINTKCSAENIADTISKTTYNCKASSDIRIRDVYNIDQQALCMAGALAQSSASSESGQKADNKGLSLGGMIGVIVAVIVVVVVIAALVYVFGFKKPKAAAAAGAAGVAPGPASLGGVTSVFDAISIPKRGSLPMPKPFKLYA
jgi:hypothetical protein